MPKSASQFSNFTSPRPKKVRLSARKAGYDGVWQRFREHFATIVIPVCGAKLGGTETEYCCGKSLPSRFMHLDHLVPFDGIDDPLRLDESNLAWRCISCHSKKTCKEDGGGWRNG